MCMAEKKGWQWFMRRNGNVTIEKVEDQEIGCSSADICYFVLFCLN